MGSEFSLIRRFFSRAATNAVLGVGDDAALLQLQPGDELAVSTDMLVEGRHFLASVDPNALGHKALAVNLSDMAAMGAQPQWALLALALPDVDLAWLTEFSEGFFALAQTHGVSLVGGDTTRGPLNITVHILGVVPSARALRRDGAHCGDDIWVSGTLGDAALGLVQSKYPNSDLSPIAAALQLRLDRPTPRVALGIALRDIATAAIDISDGLVGDLGHLCTASGWAADVDINAVPVSVYAKTLQHLPDYWQCILGGGDDYELCFTALPAHRAPLMQLSQQLETPLTRIGSLRRGIPGVYFHRADGTLFEQSIIGFDHFEVA